MNFVLGDTIDFTRLTWEAFATFLTGLVAVGGAIAIGLRQTGIQRRQVDLQQLELRRLLFDQRLPVYVTTRKWLGFILSHSTIPNRPGSMDWGQLTQAGRITELDRQRELERQFLDAIEKSRFIFSPHVFDELEKLWIEGNNLHLHGMAIKLGQDDAAPHIENQRRLLHWFSERDRYLSNVFADELKISDGAKSTFRPLAKPTA